MDLKEAMSQKNFVVLGDTINEEKYAYKIKQGLIERGKTVACVGKELKSINDVPFNIDVIDLCINPIKGLQLIKENTKNFKTIIIQPGASNDELYNYLNENNIPYFDGCILVGLKLFK